MSRKWECFLQGMLSVFSLNRSSLHSHDDIEMEKDLININPFANDADAIRHDFENIGGDIWKAINKYEQQESTSEA